MIRTAGLVGSGVGMAGVITSIVAVMNDQSGATDHATMWLLVCSLAIITASLFALLVTED